MNNQTIFFSMSLTLSTFAHSPHACSIHPGDDFITHTSASNPSCCPHPLHAPLPSLFILYPVQGTCFQLFPRLPPSFLPSTTTMARPHPCCLLIFPDSSPTNTLFITQMESLVLIELPSKPHLFEFCEEKKKSPLSRFLISF